ncbi:MAG: sulfotransferase family protein [Porticoccaceae bacterium]|nr:sulfotransferase family protein [Porticoccaceae bacterium]
MTASYQRKENWVPTPRPDWVATMNEMFASVDMHSIAPMDHQALIAQAVKNTGLEDFGDDVWIEHFKVLTESIEAEANLHFAGRCLSRSEFVRYLEIRLQLVDWIKKHPEVNDEVIDQPVFITGFGRSGTTILFELLSQDPQFRTCSKWESLFPCPPPEKDTYDTDPRIALTDKINTLNESLIPELQGMHKSAAVLPVESVEMVYFTFLSEVFPICFQLPSYDKYQQQQDMRYCFAWQKKLLQLLQSRFKAKHWLLKGPSHLSYLEEIMDVYPDAKIIFTHRDPIVSADSVVSFQGALYWWRTDKPWGDGSADNWVIGSAEVRAGIWDDIIDKLENGKIDKRRTTNFQYDEFMTDPMAAVRKIYQDLDLELSGDAEQRMLDFLAAKPQGKFGKHEYEHPPEPVIRHERQVYKRYQDYFSVPNEL